MALSIKAIFSNISSEEEKSKDAPKTEGSLGEPDNREKVKEETPQGCCGSCS
ncbi:hypothetical protein AB6E04_07880 [Vibrio amylolyticus]|uniref:hypothetical protein n=1 Tax=Vibrio amylolyticus TaxID=2847292 RepID=UPI00354F7430